jgi:RNA polymerase sigma-70 factor (ECF subfamily)
MEKYQHDFELIFKKYYSSLCYYASKFIDEDFVAEDIVQEIFSNLWEKQFDLESEPILKAYLFRSVHNRCINYINYKRITDKHKHILKDKAALKELEYYNSEPGSPKSLFEMEIKIDKIIEGLPAQCRTAFDLSRQKGLKNKEIAVAMEISVSAVEKHISKALHIMHDAFKDYLVLFLFFVQLF